MDSGSEETSSLLSSEEDTLEDALLLLLLLDALLAELVSPARLALEAGDGAEEGDDATDEGCETEETS